MVEHYDPAIRAYSYHAKKERYLKSATMWYLKSKPRCHNPCMNTYHLIIELSIFMKHCTFVDITTDSVGMCYSIFDTLLQLLVTFVTDFEWLHSMLNGLAVTT